MTKHILILQGPYRGQTLQLEDDVAAAAVKDKWGLDPAAKGYDPFAVELGSAAVDLPESLQKFLNPEEIKEEAKVAAKPEMKPIIEKEDDDNGDDKKSSTIVRRKGS